MQNNVLGIEVNGLASSRGLRAALPKGAAPPPTLRCVSPGCSTGSVISFIPSQMSTAAGTRSLACNEVVEVATEGQSGYMVIQASGYASGTAAFQSMNTVQSLVPYQMCFRPAGESAFKRTGISLVIQTQMTTLEVGHLTAQSPIPSVQGCSTAHQEMP